MSTRNYAIATLVLVTLSVGAWWLQSDRGEEEGGNSMTSGAPASSATTESYQPGAPQPAVAKTVDPNESAASEAERELPVATNEEFWSTKARQFADQSDPDPTLSRAIEVAVQMAVDTALDRSRYDLHSIACRGPSCQIVSVERASGTGTPWSMTVATIMRDLSAAAIRHPSTGMELKPRLQLLEQGMGETPGTVTMIGFQ